MVTEDSSQIDEPHKGGILYNDKQVVVVDIPSSLSSPPGSTRFSCPILKTPYQISDPKSGVPFDQGLLDLHEDLRESITQAFEVLKKQNGSLYSQRLLKEPIQSVHSDDDKAYTNVEQDAGPDFQAFSANLSVVSKLVFSNNGPIYLGDIDNEQSGCSLSLLDINNAIVVNESPSIWKTVYIQLNEAPDKFMIPPKSSFLQSTFLDCIPVVSEFSRSQDQPGFDLILLDPPWHNKSVRRAKNTYQTSKFRLDHLYKLNLSLAKSQDGINAKAGGLLRNQGIVAVWITNNTKIRTFVIEMFEYWKLEIIGEWVWVKLTEQGEPIFSLESISRKPYELLLLARGKVEDEGGSGGNGIGGCDTGNNNTAPERKVIFACPELHSRKPCIKGRLIGPPFFKILLSLQKLIILSNHRALPGW